MKKIAFLILCFSALQTQAQNGFFLEPQVGPGISNIKATYFPGTHPDTKNVFAYTGHIGVGYRLDHIVLNTGIGYLRTGAKRILLVETSPGNISSFDYYSYFYHIIVPLTASYEFRIGEKLRILPGAGLELSYNLFEKHNSIQNADHNLLEKMPSNEFDKSYKRFSLFAMANVTAEYRLNDRLSFVAGPSLDYMLTNLFKVPAGAPYISKQKNYAYCMNVGVKFNLHHKNSEGKSKDKVQ